MKSLQELVHSNLQGQREGIYSLCSANRFVLEAGVIQAELDGTQACIESTSNQVNQFGGYMGMTPADFAAFVRGMASDMGFPGGQVILGGDHLGPHVWRDQPADIAMGKAAQLVGDCVRSGYVKLHLDASMRCAGDPGGTGVALTQEVVAARTADLCRAAEAAWRSLPPGRPAPLYVIGTEVPVPGGEENAGVSGVSVTRAHDLEHWVSLAREAFLARGLEPAWERVIAVVVQPGVDFGDDWILEYDPEKARELRDCVERGRGFVLEAHSTDYQPAAALAQLVEDHFAILKVGPWLTFAFREAVFSLAAMEEEWLAARRGAECSHVREALERVMLEHPDHWKDYYRGDDAARRFARKYSYSDRSRYYWARPEVQQALKTLLSNLTRHPVPLALLSQYMPAQCLKVREHRIFNVPADLIHDKIQEVLGIYAAACGAPAPS